MIRGIFHKGSGLGNQLHRYVGSRVLALDSKQAWGMVAPELFKGSSFMDLDIGNSLSDYHIEEPAGKVIPHTTDITVDGEFQGEQYFMHRIDEVRQWLHNKRILKVPNNVCIMAFQGGEFALYSDLFLPLKYWTDAMIEMLKINPTMVFRVVTDDPTLATKFFTGLSNVFIGHDIEEDWLAIRYAKYLILSNSSFGILPAHLNENAHKIIAPKYWAGHNKGVWQLPENEYKKFAYV